MKEWVKNPATTVSLRVKRRGASRGKALENAKEPQNENSSLSKHLHDSGCAQSLSNFALISPTLFKCVFLLTRRKVRLMSKSVKCKITCSQDRIYTVFGNPNFFQKIIDTYIDTYVSILSIHMFLKILIEDNNIFSMLFCANCFLISYIFCMLIFIFINLVNKNVLITFLLSFKNICF